MNRGLRRVCRQSIWQSEKVPIGIVNQENRKFAGIRNTDVRIVPFAEDARSGRNEVPAAKDILRHGQVLKIPLRAELRW